MDGAVVALGAIGIGVAGNLAVVIYGYGKLTSSVSSMRDDIKEVKGDIKDVTAKINGHVQWHAERPDRRA